MPAAPLGILASIGLILVLVAASSPAWSAEPSAATATSGPDIIRADAERTKALAELKRIDLDREKAADVRTQYYVDLTYRIGLTVAALILLLILVPQITEFSMPWGPGVFSFKRVPKQPAGSQLPEPIDVQAAEVLKKELPPGPPSDKLVERVEEGEVYRSAGVKPDSIYVCHTARRIPRSEDYRVRMYLDADDSTILEKVERVTYVLNMGAGQQRDETRTSSADRFQLDFRVWGEFMLYASVYFRGIAKPISLKRYLNL
jgi:hypothetical protein